MTQRLHLGRYVGANHAFAAAKTAVTSVANPVNSTDVARVPTENSPCQTYLRAPALRHQIALVALIVIADDFDHEIGALPIPIRALFSASMNTMSASRLVLRVAMR